MVWILYLSSTFFVEYFASFHFKSYSKSYDILVLTFDMFRLSFNFNLFYLFSTTTNEVWEFEPTIINKIKN